MGIVAVELDPADLSNLLFTGAYLNMSPEHKDANVVSAEWSVRRNKFLVALQHHSFESDEFGDLEVVSPTVILPKDSLKYFTSVPFNPETMEIGEDGVTVFYKESGAEIAVDVNEEGNYDIPDTTCAVPFNPETMERRDGLVFMKDDPGTVVIVDEEANSSE